MTASDGRGHRRLKELFAAAAELAPAERAAFLDRECPPELRAELDELLAYAEPVGFLAPDSDAPPPAVAALAAAPAAPERLGAYTIEGEIGSGGMGRVFVATQASPRRKVALKIMHHPQVGELAQRFAREAELLGRLEHPGIARIYEAGVDRETGVPFIAMELVEGTPLGAHVAAAKLDDDARLALVADLADAIAHAHQKGVIHRDLKPANVLVNDAGRPVVLDFGVARPELASEHDSTQAGQLIGTVAYMSPEQAAGRTGDVDTRTDVYALGVIAYELLSRGRRPHDIDDLALHDALRRVVEEPARPLTEHRPELRGDVSTIVHKALAGERDRRYPSASALADDIRRYLRNEPIAARPATTMYQLRKFAARNRGVVASAALALVALLAGTGVATWQAIVAGQTAARERVAKERAERRLGDVRRFATDSIFRIHDRIKHLQGSAEARQMLVDLGLDALEKLHAEEGDDPTLMREVAQAYVWQGRLRGGDSYHRGDSADAAQCFARGITLWRQVVDGDYEPEPRDRSRLGLALYHLAQHHADAHRFDRAEELLRDAVAVMRPGLTAFPDDPELPGDLGSVLTRLGRVLLRRGDDDAAIELFEEGLRRCQESLDRATAPADRVYHARGLAVSHNWLGNWFFGRGELDRAEREYRRFHDHAMQLHALVPDDELDQSNLAVAEHKLAGARLARDDVAGAITFAARAVALLEPLVSSDPHNLARTYQLISVTNRAVTALLAADRPADALALLERGADYERVLREGAGENADWHHGIGRRGELEARGLLALARPAAAAATLERTAASADFAPPSGRSDTGMRLLADRELAWFRIHRGAGDDGAALAAAQRLAGLASRLGEADDTDEHRGYRLGATLLLAAVGDGDVAARRVAVERARDAAAAPASRRRLQRFLRAVAEPAAGRQR